MTCSPPWTIAIRKSLGFVVQDPFTSVENIIHIFKSGPKCWTDWPSNRQTDRHSIPRGFNKHVDWEWIVVQISPPRTYLSFGWRLCVNAPVLIFVQRHKLFHGLLMALYFISALHLEMSLSCSGVWLSCLHLAAVHPQGQKFIPCSCFLFCSIHPSLPLLTLFFFVFKRKWCRKWKITRISANKAKRWKSSWDNVGFSVLNEEELSDGGNHPLIHPFFHKHTLPEFRLTCAFEGEQQIVLLYSDLFCWLSVGSALHGGLNTQIQRKPA